MSTTVLKGKELEDKLLVLKKVQVDSENWIVYYQDEVTKEKWKKEYPESEYHGGGIPVLVKIDKFPWE